MQQGREGRLTKKLFHVVRPWPAMRQGLAERVWVWMVRIQNEARGTGRRGSARVAEEAGLGHGPAGG